MSLGKGAEIVLKNCLAAKPGEKILIVTDTAKHNIGKALFEKAVEMELKAKIVVMKPTGAPGKEPPAMVADEMKRYDIVVCPTQYSMTHTQARKSACDHGARVATMPGITGEMFSQGALTADYRQVAALSDRVAELLDQADQVRIEKDGRILTMSVQGRTGISSRGLLHHSGSSGNFPSGEAYIAPLEDTAEGEMVIDGSVSGIGLLKAPLQVRIEKGQVVRLNGPDAECLEKILGQNQDNRNTGELGIGTNPKARLIGNVLEDEKVYGTVHIAFGSNITFGGVIEAGVHIDCIILMPRLYLDDRLVVENGSIII